MATPIITEEATISSQERTWRVQIECPNGSDYTLQAYREVIRTVDGEPLGQPDKTAGVVTRTLSGAAADQVTLESGKTVTVLELAEALVKHIEAWREVDLTSAPVPEPEEEE